MIIIAIIIGIMILLLSAYNFKKLSKEFTDGSCIGGVIFGFIALLVIGLSTPSAITAIDAITSEDSIKTTITILEEENTEMNNEIKTTVMGTLNTESDFYKELANSNSTSTTISIILKYPELNSIDLVDKYINIYRYNQTEIKQKKIELAEIRKWKKLLYFGS